MTRPDRKPAAARSRPAAGPSPFALHAESPAIARWATPAAWALVALFAAALGAMIAGPHQVGDVFTESDFYGAYGVGARALQHGHVDPSRYGVVGPVYEMLLALVGFVVRDLFVAAELLALAGMSALLLLWFRIVRARAGALAGLITVAALAANAWVFRYGYAATTDAPALALQALALALLLVGPADAKRAAWAGAVAGLAFLTRYNAVALLPAGAIAVLAGWTDTPAESRRRAALAFAGGFLAPVLPWIGYSLASGAHFRFMLHHNIAYEVFARARGIPWDTYERSMESQFPTAWSVFARDPGAVTGRILANVVDHLRLDATLVAGLPLAIAAALGLVLGARGGGLSRLNGVWLAAGLLFLSLVPAFHSERYSLAVLPAWAALAGVALGSPRLALVLSAGGRRAWLKPLLALPLVALLADRSVVVQKRAISQLPLEVRTVATQAAPLLKPGERVYARKPHFAWHAGLTATAFPFVDSLAQLAAAAKRDGVRWLYFSWPEAEMRPQFMYLLDTTAVVPGLVPRVVTSRHPAVLYEIVEGFGAEPAWASDPWRVTLHRARAMVAIDRTDWRSRVIVANQAQREEKWDEAESLLVQAEARAPDDPETVLSHADNLVHLGRYAEARERYERIERIAPGQPRTRIGAGWAALLAGDPNMAAELWRPMVPYVEDAGTLQRMLQLFDSIHDITSVAQVRARLRAIDAAGATP